MTHLKKKVHKINDSDGTKNLCDGTNKGDYHSKWKFVTCKKCRLKKPGGAK